MSASEMLFFTRYFGLMVGEHNELYIKLFGRLTIKFHMLLHYVRLIKRMDHQ